MAKSCFRRTQETGADPRYWLTGVVFLFLEPPMISETRQVEMAMDEGRMEPAQVDPFLWAGESGSRYAPSIRKKSWASTTQGRSQGQQNLKGQASPR